MIGLPESSSHCSAAQPGTPAVSIIMANHNCGAYLRSCITSVLSQSYQNFELIVVDDASTDSSIDILQQMSAEDPRMRISLSSRNAGPGAARNRALELARGEWIAVVDSDDLIHPHRLSEMLAAAERSKADIVADDLIVFDDAGLRQPRLLLGWSQQRTIDLAAFLVSNRLDGTQPCLGLLKPVFRRVLLNKSTLRYDETLMNGEDADFITYMLAEGARMVVVPGAWYLYRKHEGSISRRLTESKVQSMAAALERFRQRHTTLSRQELKAFDIVLRSYRSARDLIRLIAAVKSRRVAKAVQAIWNSPYAAIQLAQLVGDRLSQVGSRRRQVRKSSTAGRRQICVLSQGMIIADSDPAITQSVAGLKSLFEGEADLHLICPSPAVFARSPWFHLKPWNAVFATISVRRSICVGRTIFATDPGVWLEAARKIFRGSWRSKSNLALGHAPNLTPGVQTDWVSADQIFVAVKSLGRADAVVCETAFMGQGLPYVLAPDVRFQLIGSDSAPVCLGSELTS